MEIGEMEGRLFDLMSRSHFRDADAGRPGDPHPDGVPLKDVLGVGLDTNILKQLGRDTIFASKMKTTLDQAAIPLIVPGQCVVEFWNSYRKFASNDASKLRTDVAKLKGVVAQMGVLSLAEGRLAQIEGIVEEIVREVSDATAENYLENARLMMNLILKDAIQPMVSRVKFNDLALARQGCKVPPGFADEANKVTSSLGDFFAWCDFVMGALSSMSAGREGVYLFVTDDGKPDWKTGRSGHPELIYEFGRVTGSRLVVLTFAELRASLERESPRAEDEADSEL